MNFFENRQGPSQTNNLHAGELRSGVPWVHERETKAKGQEGHFREREKKNEGSKEGKTRVPSEGGDRGAGKGRRNREHQNRLGVKGPVKSGAT